MTVEGRRVTAAVLEKFAFDVARDRGMSADHAELFATALVGADLRGISTHGTYRLPAYARAMRSGDVNPAPVVEVVRSRAASELWDGDNGSGLVLGRLAMRRAVEMARTCGIGAVAVRRSNHAGMLAIHVEEAVREGMIGYFVANAPGLMAPFAGQEPVLSNGPFAYGIPTRGEPLIADMACSLVARGKIRLAAERGDAIPLGWAVDGEGRETTDAAAAMQGVILPMAGHKGYALAVINEILAASLPGAVLSMNMSRQFMRPEATAYDSWGAGHLAIAIDPDAFGGREEFLDSVEALGAGLKGSLPGVGFDEVLMPGEPEQRRHDELVRDGIPVAGPVLRALEEFCEEFELTWPVD